MFVQTKRNSVSTNISKDLVLKTTIAYSRSKGEARRAIRKEMITGAHGHLQPQKCFLGGYGISNGGDQIDRRKGDWAIGFFAIAAHVARDNTRPCALTHGGLRPPPAPHPVPQSSPLIASIQRRQILDRVTVTQKI
ncbi:hypothetical protein EVAR_35369_1 [Eumeta japonica]|uniref:Uncharacterized protein n=1 Tax=Eumeta variegata TaxID=151549 RepID=A0A4C1ZW00_EUMVA|nr:hypothetical protein EVAR_35369_1 [Eumeta japonica]